MSGPHCCLFYHLSRVALQVFSVTMASKKWIPLESNPDVLNDFAQKLGMDTSGFAFTDVYGLDAVGGHQLQ